MPSGTILGVTVGQEVGAGVAGFTSPFPPSARVIYRENPLVDVTCHLRFTPVLKIESERPAAFQEDIREALPLFREKPLMPSFPPQMPSQMAAVITQQLGLQGKRIGYEFASSDDHWVVTLTMDSLSLSSRRYPTWEEFKTKLAGPLQSLSARYKPAFFVRIGLRYQNLIHRSKLGLKDVPWAELLKPQISGLMAVTNVAAAQSTALIKFEGERGQVKIVHGLVQNAEDQQECYLIDSDFFTDRRIEFNDAIEQLNFFNSQSGLLFRWCITEKLHLAMGPIAGD